MKHLTAIFCSALLLSVGWPALAQQLPSRFAYAGRDSHMLHALRVADSVLTLPAFWAAIRTHPNQQLDSSSYTMGRLADVLQSFKQPVAISRSRSPFHSSLAETSSSGITIYWKAHRQSDIWLAITMIHEWVHGVDFKLNNPLSFAHLDDQNPCVSRNTASYRIEQVAVDLIGRRRLGETQFEKRYGCSN